MGAGIEPHIASAHEAQFQLPAVKVFLVNRCYFKLAPGFVISSGSDYTFLFRNDFSA